MVARHSRVLALLLLIGVAACGGRSAEQVLDGAESRRDVCRSYAAEATGIAVDQISAEFIQSNPDGGAEYIVRGDGRAYRCAVSGDRQVERFGAIGLRG